MTLRLAPAAVAAIALTLAPRVGAARELAYRDAPGCPPRAEVAARIDDVVDALVLVVALADVPPSREADPEPEPQPAPPPVADAPVTPERIEQRRAGAIVSLGVAGDATSWGGRALPGGSLFGDVAARGAFGIPWLAPSARAGIVHGFRAPITSDGLEAATTTGRPWSRAGGLVRARFDAGSRAFVEIATGLLAPLTRYRFPGWGGDVPSLQWSLALGGGVVLP